MLHLKNNLQKIAGKLMDILYPLQCISCNQKVDSAHSFCQKCWSKVEFIGKPCCEKCSIPLPVDYLGRRCYKCVSHPPKFDVCISVFRYDDFTKKLIHDFKFNDKTGYAKSFAHMMYNQSGQLLEQADVVIPVPMHKTRVQRRKYNHATLIARNISKLSGVKLEVDALIKLRPSVNQMGLNRLERARNLLGAFSVSDDSLIRNKSIVLVDDVLTTGATASECAKTLKQFGAKKIIVLTAARTY
ncbi:MAG: ComF family protein [Candidatus Jidaibacter sp.]|jgi:ComF family protein|nr:ComF family protein [Candidatus Jidaibacter sp.]